MKDTTFKTMYESALKTAEKERKAGYETEVVLVPVVVSKMENGKIGSISGVETNFIFNE